mgnify:CR=1 FL=1
MLILTLGESSRTNFMFALLAYLLGEGFPLPIFYSEER